MTISALRKVCFLLSNIVGTCTTCVHCIHKHVVPTCCNAWVSCGLWRVTLLTALPSSRHSLKLCIRPLRIQEMKQSEVQSWGRHQKKQHLSLSGWAGPETQPARSRGLVSGPKARWWDACYTCEYMAHKKLLGQRPPAMGEYSEHLQWYVIPASLRSGCQKPQSFS